MAPAGSQSAAATGRLARAQGPCRGAVSRPAEGPKALQSVSACSKVPRGNAVRLEAVLPRGKRRLVNDTDPAMAGGQGQLPCPGPVFQQQVLPAEGHVNDCRSPGSDLPARTSQVAQEQVTSWVPADAEVLSVLKDSFSKPMENLRGHALQSVSAQASYFNVGAFSHADRKGISKETSNHEAAVKVLNAWLGAKFPHAHWSSLAVNHNETLKLHRDTSNEPNTLNFTAALGAFSGGGLFVEDSKGDVFRFCPALQTSIPGFVHDTLKQPLAFSGQRWHQSEPWVGDRYVITAYTCSNLGRFASADIARLAGLGFPLPPGVSHKIDRSSPA